MNAQLARPVRKQGRGEDARRRADGVRDARGPHARAPGRIPGLPRQAVRPVRARHAGGAPRRPGSGGLKGDLALSQDGAARGADIDDDAPPAARGGVTPRPREFNPTLIARLEAFSRATGSFVIVVGCLVLLGWVLGRGALASVFPAAGAMKANAAFCFILAGASLRLMQTGPDTPRTRLVVQGYAWAVSVVGLLTRSEHLLGWNLHIDQLLVRETKGVVATTVPGRMAPAEAGTFLLLAAAPLLLGDPSLQWRRSSQGLTLTAALISWEALLGHAYGVRSEERRVGKGW